MMLSFLKSKIHRATVTDANLHYQGSISIDRNLMKQANILQFEEVYVYNVTNGERFQTYAIEGGDGVICLNGAAAWKARVNDKVIVATYCQITAEEAKTFRPTLVFVGEHNELISVKDSFDKDLKV